MEVQGVGVWVCIYNIYIYIFYIYIIYIYISVCVCMYTVAHRVNPIYFAKIRLLQIKML